MGLHSLGGMPWAGALAAWCGAPPHSVPVLLLAAGLVGGVAHCGPMCGPFILAQAAHGGTGGPALQRLGTGLLLPYHLGRLSTYALLGAFAAMLGRAVIAAGPVRWGLVAVLLAAAGLFGAQAAARLAPLWPGGRWFGRLAVAWAGRLARLAQPMLADPSAVQRWALGSVLGLLPCGFLYGALAAAAATGNPVAGALAMMAFGLGTLPSLFLVGVGGAGLARRWHSVAARLLAPLFLFNAAALTAMALSIAVAS